MSQKTKIIVALSVIILIGAVGLAVTQDDPFAQIQYPVKELGNCQDKTDCAAYCDQEQNMKACLDFAQKYALLPQEEIEIGQKMIEAGQAAGPGGCKGMDACMIYCDDVNHLKECTTFAEKYNLVSPEELQEMKIVASAMEKGITPPNCKSKKDCDIYCSMPENMQECITFGEAAGLIPPQELQEAKKALEAVKKGVKPPPCTGKKSCDVYCQQAEHMQECMEFAMAAGFMSPEEAKNAKATLEALKKGIKPPNCRGKEECDNYCNQPEYPEHMAECMEFGIAAGLMPPEEIENAKKTLQALKQGVKMPKCRGKEECDIYCNQSEHMVECMEFGIAAGFMPPEDLENAKKTLEAIKKGAKQPNCRGKEECDVYCKQPEHMAECMEFSIAAGYMPPEEMDNAKKTLEAIKKGVMPPRCNGQEECQTYCQQPEHIEECINFSEAAGFMSPEDAARARQGMQQGPQPQGPIQPGPGGCQTPEECQSYCASNPQECQNFQAPMPPATGGMGGGGIPTQQPGEFIQVQPVCESPEQCQQMQQQIQQQIQNQMAPPQPCEGEGCNYGPPPTEQPSGQQPMQPQQPPAPMEQNPPSPIQPMPQAPLEGQQPILQAPTTEQQPPSENPPTSAPTGLLSPETFLGSILSIFNQLLRPLE